MLHLLTQRLPRGGGCAARLLATFPAGAPTPGGLPLYYSEAELEEQFVRGSGAGGQSVAKTSNCVILRHVPTGILVRCHATRSRETNRRIARKELQLRLDELHRGAGSVRSQQECVSTRRRRAGGVATAGASVPLAGECAPRHPPPAPDSQIRARCCRAKIQRRSQRASAKARTRHAQLAELKRVAAAAEALGTTADAVATPAGGRAAEELR